MDLLAMVGAVVLLILFYQQQERSRLSGKLPLVDMALLSEKRFAIGAILVFLVYSTSSSFFLSFALLIQTGMQINPFVAGSIFAPCSIGFVVASLVTPKFIARWGEKVIVIGAFIYALSIGLLILQVYESGAELIAVLLIPLLSFIGFGQGTIMTPLLNLVLGFVDKKQAGMASGVVSTVQQVGAAFGVAVIGILFSTALSNGGESVDLAIQYSCAFVVGMLYNFFASIIVCFLLFKLVSKRKDIV
ncbi:MFS transporter [Vibrio sonorensis]|uniref:MFS transporter n=1 Tax=Vibrio sonorensis TaxID=1004316 RepID=UPI001C2F89D7|nr:MFS transporter [Vibrio sonorensis]